MQSHNTSKEKTLTKYQEAALSDIAELFPKYFTPEDYLMLLGGLQSLVVTDRKSSRRVELINNGLQPLVVDSKTNKLSDFEIASNLTEFWSPKNIENIFSEEFFSAVNRFIERENKFLDNILNPSLNERSSIKALGLPECYTNLSRTTPIVRKTSSATSINSSPKSRISTPPQSPQASPLMAPTENTRGF
jgi:hypothetical protein